MPLLCPNCGKESSGAASFCYECGVKLRRQRDQVLTIACGLSVVTSLLCMPLLIFGVISLFTLLSPPPSYPPTTPPLSLTILSILSIPASILGFAGGLSALEGKGKTRLYLGFTLLILTGIAELNSDLSSLGELVVLLSLLGAVFAVMTEKTPDHL